MVEIQEMQQQAGSGGGEGLLLGTTGGSFQSSLHMPQTCAAAKRGSAELRDGAGSLPPPDCLSASTQTGYWNAQAIFSRLCQ